MGNDHGESLTTIVNQTVALENVSKLAKSQGYEFEVEQKEDDYYIYMHKTDEINNINEEKEDDIAILISSKLFGQGDEELGEILMQSFLYTINEMQGKVKHLLFMNSAIYLTVEGSPVLEHLLSLEKQGIEILSCGTCLDYYNKKDDLRVGRVTNMYTATEILINASKSITL